MFLKTIGSRNGLRLQQKNLVMLSQRNFSSQGSDEYETVYESNSKKKYTLPSVLSAGTSVFWAITTTSYLASTAEMSLFTPILGLTTSLLFWKYTASQYSHYVTEIKVKDEHSPVLITTKRFLGLLPKHIYVDRSNLLGFPEDIDTAVLSGENKSLAFKIKGDPAFYFLDKKGLFNAEYISSIIGYDPRTYIRCPPSKPFKSKN